MTNMECYEKSLITLELPGVLAMLAEEAVSDAARERALALRPAAERFEVKRRLEETTAAKTMMAVKGSPSFGGVKDVCGSLTRADMSGILNTRELLDIANLLQCARAVRSYMGGDSEKMGQTPIDNLFRSLQPNRYLEDKIRGAVLGEEEIADSASSELADIRRKIRAANARVREALQKIISSPSYAKALQEPIITQRSERYVVPVKVDHKSAVPGLVHDVSASGATLFVEPMGAVKANNQLREFRAKERQEIERILMELSAECAQFREDITRDYELLVTLDFIFAKARLSFRLDCQAPILAEDGRLWFRRARHPLLDPKTAVPIDIVLGDDFDTLVITGPNTGGKTVCLKTLGLLCAMTQCGLHIPVMDGSCVPLFQSILADIGDEQSIEQNLSTFSSHMVNIVRLLDQCDNGSLLLFDELGAGTDPTEGAALAISIIEYARKCGARIAATTHYAELKVYATTQEGVQNASCEFDVETLRPTYRLLIGIPGKSNAFAISSRLGLPKDIITDAKTRVGRESTSFETVVERLADQQHRLEAKEAEIDKRLLQTEEDNKKAARLRRELEVRLEKADQKARRDAQRLLEEVRQTADQVFAELDEMRRRQNEEEDHRVVNEARAELRRRLNTAEEELRKKEDSPSQERRSARPVKKGDMVELLSMGVQGEVLSVSADRVLEVQAGILRMKVKEGEVFLLENVPRKKSSVAAAAAIQLQATAAASELDIRGLETLEAVPVLERFLDNAVLAKLKKVSIIHGKGTGALRQVVHIALQRNRQVKSFRLGRYGEGENGVTIVELK